MPKLSQIFVKSSLLYLLTGFALGALILLQKGWAFWLPAWQLLPLHIEIVIFGWMLQLVMGVAYWMLPRFGAERRRETAAWLAYCLMNGGILLTFATLIADANVLRFFAKILQVAAVGCFVFHAWPRIKPFSEMK